MIYDIVGYRKKCYPLFELRPTAMCAVASPLGISLATEFHLRTLHVKLLGA